MHKDEKTPAGSTRLYSPTLVWRKEQGMLQENERKGESPIKSFRRGARSGVVGCVFCLEVSDGSKRSPIKQPLRVPG